MTRQINNPATRVGVTISELSVVPRLLVKDEVLRQEIAGCRDKYYLVTKSGLPTVGHDFGAYRVAARRGEENVWVIATLRHLTKEQAIKHVRGEPSYGKALGVVEHIRRWTNPLPAPNRQAMEPALAFLETQTGEVLRVVTANSGSIVDQAQTQQQNTMEEEQQQPEPPAPTKTLEELAEEALEKVHVNGHVMTQWERSSDVWMSSSCRSCGAVVVVDERGEAKDLHILGGAATIECAKWLEEIHNGYADEYRRRMVEMAPEPTGPVSVYRVPASPVQTFSNVMTPDRPEEGRTGVVRVKVLGFPEMEVPIDEWEDWKRDNDNITYTIQSMPGE